jgi:hypothetical protein
MKNNVHSKGPKGSSRKREKTDGGYRKDFFGIKEQSIGRWIGLNGNN